MTEASPPAAVICLAVGARLKELAARLPEGERFDLLVAARLVGTVAREAALAPQASKSEAERLRTLGCEGTSLVEQNRALAALIRSGAMAYDDPYLVAHLRATLRDALAIDHPRRLSDPD